MEGDKYHGHIRADSGNHLILKLTVYMAEVILIVHFSFHSIITLEFIN